MAVVDCVNAGVTSTIARARRASVAVTTAAHRQLHVANF
jgi:hypothetical protein